LGLFPACTTLEDNGGVEAKEKFTEYAKDKDYTPNGHGVSFPGSLIGFNF